MEYSPVVLLIVVVAISSLHMVAPDHWVPVTLTAFRRRLTRRRTYVLASSIGITHGVTSALLSVAVGEAGLLFLPVVYVRLMSALLLVAIALYIMVNSAREAGRPRGVESASLLVSVIPDPTLVPFVLFAFDLGPIFVSLITGLFIAATSLSLLMVVVLSYRGLERALSNIKPIYIDMVVAATLVAMAAFVYFFG